MISIVSNGSRFAGAPLATLDELFEALETHALSYHFNCISVITDKMKQYRGNFIDVSHVFNIYTDEKAVIDRFETAFAKNKATPKYKAQIPRPRKGKNELCN